jgi:hypothetical protein
MPPMSLMRQVRRNLPEYHAVQEKAVSLRVVAWSAVAFIASIPMSYAGPCTDDIGRMQGRIDDKLAAKAAAGPYAVESSRAQRSDQPTPRSMAATEERLGEISPQTVDAARQAMARARAADSAGAKTACEQALADVQRALGRDK